MENKLTFDDDKHRYFYDGRNVPGVNEIIEACGLVDFSAVPEEQLEAARKLGNYVHQATALWDKDDLVVETLSPGLIPYLEGWKLFLSDFNIKFAAEQIERRLYSRKWGFAGTTDRDPVEIGGRMTLIDLKTSTSMLKTYALTTAGYKILQEENYGKIKQRWGVQLLPTGKYKIHIYDNPTDESVFLSCLNVYNWKKNGG
jgi:hypothetical protein